MQKKTKHTHIYIYIITIIILSIQTHCPGNDIYIENTYYSSVFIDQGVAGQRKAEQGEGGEVSSGPVLCHFLFFSWVLVSLYNTFFSLAFCYFICEENGQGKKR